MTRKPWMKAVTTALGLGATIAAVGCGSTTVYRPSPEDTRDLSAAQARKVLIKTAPAVAGCTTPTYAAVTHETFRYGCRGPYRFAEHPTLVSMVYVGDPVEGHVEDKTCIGPKEVSVNQKGFRNDWRDEDCMFWRGHDASSEARDFVRAWSVWARDGTAFHLAQEAAFEKASQSYRQAATKPQLPEEAVKYKVQAELAVQQKRYDDAVDLYDQALAVAPWWPQGHYNRGLILGELEDYEEAIPAFQKYLKLEPDVANARAVQLKIYQWEGLAKAPAK